ncbi:MAG: hypothetical protein CSA83_01555 [Actinomycetales bacterium]|nr:MAG: hypothetical protein CSA83_01555 [Actinomycetales bacterium]
MAQPDHLRCSDEDRTFVEQVLNTAYADGRITLEEHQNRLDQVWKAKTFGELRPLTDDLIAVEQQLRAETKPEPKDGFPRAVVDLLHPAEEPDTITTILGGHRRIDEPWRLRRNTNITAALGEVKLDLTKAVFESERCVINFMVAMADVKIKVPAGVRITNQVGNFLADIKITGLVPEEDGPEIVLKGVSTMADIKIIGPNRKQSLGKKLFGQSW